MTLLFIKDSFGWGFLLWLIGYALGILLFTLVPLSMIGWVIMPIGILLTLWVLRTKIAPGSLTHFVLIALIWSAIAVACDYVFLVQAFHPADGYYKRDVYLYYALTFLLPILAGRRGGA